MEDRDMSAKKIFKIIMCLTLVITLFLSSSNITAFASVPSSWAQTDVTQATTKGLVIPETSSNYQSAISREVFCKLIVNMVEQRLGSPVEITIDNPFVDTDDVWIIKAYQLGIVNGVSPTEFAPNNNVTREQITAMMMNALKKLDKLLGTSTATNVDISGVSFADESEISAWALTSIKEANVLGVINGVGENRINPKGNATIEQSILLTLRLYNKNAEVLEVPPATNDELVTVFKGDSPYEEQFEIWDITTEVFSQETLKSLGADGFTGTDAEIAQQIVDWQTANMDYAGPDKNYDDAGYTSRWNFMIPGIFPASKRIEQVNSVGKIYGICYDYAYIYVAIANAYGLETRVTTLTLEKHKELFGELPPGPDDETTFRGLSRDEYELLKVHLDENDIDLNYDQIHRAIQGISTLEGHKQGIHSRAEVKIDGQWVAMEVKNAIADPSPEYLDSANYIPQNWDGIYNPIRLYAPAFWDSSITDGPSPIDYDAVGEYLSYGPQVVYTGITDDYGNEDRAGDINAFANGDGYLPYVNSPEGLMEFLHLSKRDLGEDYEDYKEMLVDFYEGTGRPFNIIADFLIYEDDMNPEEYARKYNGCTGDNISAEEIRLYAE